MHKILRQISGRIGLKNITFIVRIYQFLVSLFYRNKFDQNLSFRGSNFYVGMDLGIFPSVYSGDFESAELDLALSQNFSKGSVIWDVGANVGIWSVLLAQRFPESKVLSFEPQKTTLDLLEKNIFQNSLTNIEVFKMGLGASCEEVELVTPNGRAGSSSLIPLKKKKSDIVELIAIVTGDSIIKARPELIPRFIKVDIEGYEPKMIQGCARLIRDHRPIIMLEVSPKLWGQDLFAEWESTFDFLIQIYGGGLSCESNIVSDFSNIEFTKLNTNHRNFFFGLNLID